MKSRMALISAFLLTIATFSLSAQAEQSTPAQGQPKPTLQCSKGDGAYLCNQMLEISALLDYTCSGWACNQLWYAEISQMSYFVRTYDSVIASAFFAETDIATMAQSLSKKMCAMTATGSVDILANLAIKMNSTLVRLKLLQEAAKQPLAVTTCTISI